MFFTLLLISAFAASTLAEKETVVYLHVLFRHGNRTPDIQSAFPTDPHKNETYNPFGFGQLTTKGKKTEYEIGKYLRQTYDFIPKQYTPDTVYAISTNFKRTKMSLELVLAGLFPPLETDSFDDDLNWQPISYNVEENEQLIRIPLINCPNFIHQYYKYILSPEGAAILNSYKELYQNLSNQTGLVVTTPEEVLDIFETLESEFDYGFQLPEWTDELFPEVLADAASLYFEFATATPFLRKLTNGNLVKKILEDSVAKRDGFLPEDRKVSLYSAHDFHVSALLSTLNVYFRHMPPYGATIFLEVHNINGVYGIQVFYQDYMEASPRLLTIPGCSSFCELEKFAELMAENIPGDLDVCTYTGELL